MTAKNWRFSHAATSFATPMRCAFFPKRRNTFFGVLTHENLRRITHLLFKRGFEVNKCAAFCRFFACANGERAVQTNRVSPLLRLRHDLVARYDGVDYPDLECTLRRDAIGEQQN